MITQWINVKDSLPKDNEAVNITWVNRNPVSYYANIKDKPFTATGVYYKGNWYWWSATIQDYLDEYGIFEPEKIDETIEVIAWMPLPKPYIENEVDIYKNTSILNSNDLISKSEAIKEIKRFIDYLDEDMILRLSIAINRIQPIQSEHKASWIKCSDKLPSTDKQVLFYDNSGQMYCGFYNSKYDWWQSGSGVLKSCFVTHWMSLPFPPEDK